MEIAFEKFKEDFAKAVSYNSTLGEQAQDKLYGMKKAVGNVISTLSNQLDKASDNNLLQKAEVICKRAENEIENIATKLTKDIEKEARKRGINLIMIGKAFGELFDRMGDAFSKLIVGIKKFCADKAINSAVAKSTQRNLINIKVINR
jgi:hypothetical protein